MHLYLHVPFCHSRCLYCDFYLELAKYGGISAYCDALLREIAGRFTIRAREGGSNPLRPLQTLYFGGGTPSLLNATQVRSILQAIAKEVPFDPHVEITFELNPDDAESPLDAYLDAGINRFSVGVQSLNPQELKKLSRRHQKETVLHQIHALADLMKEKVNISIDLMYGIPLQSFSSWQDTVKEACQLPIQHISMYGLQVEAGTALETLRKKVPHHYPLPSEEEEVLFYEWAVSYLADAGFERYEVSNFARRGFESRHNLAYWQQKDVLACGPSAHGYQHPWRYQVPSDLKAYQRYQNLEDITLKEAVSEWERLENLLIFGLRMTQAGVSLNTLKEACPHEDAWPWLSAYLDSWVDQGYLRYEEEHLCLAPQWISCMNTVLKEFMGLETIFLNALSR